MHTMKREAIASKSFSIPNNWQQPKFAIGDRVTYCDRHCVMSCTVRGMEYFPTSANAPAYVQSLWPSGWSYYIWPDHNSTISPLTLEEALTQPVDESELERI